MNGHHLIMGQLTDFITGAQLPDTHDERYRQKLARWLVEQKGYPPGDVRPYMLEIQAGGKDARIPVTWTVWQNQRLVMLVHYGPGSLVTRHRPALAMSRLAVPYQVPLVVVTNGETADILEGASGTLITSGLDGIPTAAATAERMRRQAWSAIAANRIEMERRILMAYEVDDRCPCDDTISCTRSADERS